MTFKICIDKPFDNCDKVYPIQQKKVRALMDAMLPNDNIQKIIIFGSSVTDSCHIGSDVDVYVETAEKQKKLIRTALLFKYDLWTNFSVDGRLLTEITKKGVVVWQRHC